MNATILYVEACKCMLSIGDDMPGSWGELFQLLPKLRQSLSCRVCRGLLVDPFGSQSCEHYVCRGCLRKKRSLNPGCRWCLNMEILVPDKQTQIVLACYQKLCEFVLESGAVRQLKSQNGEWNAIVAVIHEAIASPISMDDCFKSQSTIPNTVNSSLPDPKNCSGKSNDKMEDQSRDLTRQHPAEVITPLPKRRIVELLKEFDGDKDEKPKKKRKKHFKGTIYNYNKKKKLSKMLDSEKETLLDQQFMGTIQTIENAQDSNEDVQVVDEIDDKPMFIETDLSAQIAEKQWKGRLCRCGVSSLGSRRKCIGKRCPCFSRDKPCEHCSCCNCANPFNNNNGKAVSEHKPSTLNDRSATLTVS